MIVTIAGSHFKDCGITDFEHYFYKTILLWNISETKKRIFLCESVGSSGIVGNYLTIKREFKSKVIAFSEWWKYLDIIPPYARIFNTENVAGTWFPSLSKYLKKSMPQIGTNIAPVTLYGKPTADDTTTQNLLANIFNDFYARKPTPSLEEVFHPPYSSKRAVAAQGDFIVDRLNSSLIFKNSSIGHIIDDKIRLTDPRLLDLVIDEGGVTPSRVKK